MAITYADCLVWPGLLCLSTLSVCSVCLSICLTVCSVCLSLCLLCCLSLAAFSGCFYFDTCNRYFILRWFVQRLTHTYTIPLLLPFLSPLCLPLAHQIYLMACWVVVSAPQRGAAKVRSLMGFMLCRRLIYLMALVCVISCHKLLHCICICCSSSERWGWLTGRALMIDKDKRKVQRQLEGGWMRKKVYIELYIEYIYKLRIRIWMCINIYI